MLQLVKWVLYDGRGGDDPACSFAAGPFSLRDCVRTGTAFAGPAERWMQAPRAWMQAPAWHALDGKGWVGALLPYQTALMSLPGLAETPPLVTAALATGASELLARPARGWAPA